jgi:hypothetical protein
MVQNNAQQIATIEHIPASRQERLTGIAPASQEVTEAVSNVLKR